MQPLWAIWAIWAFVVADWTGAELVATRAGNGGGSGNACVGPRINCPQEQRDGAEGQTWAMVGGWVLHRRNHRLPRL